MFWRIANVWCGFEEVFHLQWKLKITSFCLVGVFVVLAWDKCCVFALKYDSWTWSKCLIYFLFLSFDFVWSIALIPLPNTIIYLIIWHYGSIGRYFDKQNEFQRFHYKSLIHITDRREHFNFFTITYNYKTGFVMSIRFVDSRI